MSYIACILLLQQSDMGGGLTIVRPVNHDRSVLRKFQLCLQLLADNELNVKASFPYVGNLL